MSNRIRAVRKQNRFSQAELAQRLEVSEPTISNYETGKREPDKATWVRLSRILGVSVDYLMGLDAEKAATPEGSGLDEDTLKLARRYQSMNAEGRKAMRALAKVLAQDDDNE